MLNRGESSINYNDDPHYRELTNKDSIDCILSSTSYESFSRILDGVKLFSNFQPRIIKNKSRESGNVPPSLDFDDHHC